MTTLATDPKLLWQESFEEQIARQAYNTAAVEALVRNIAYYLRARYSPDQWRNLHFMEMGCGAGPNLIWLAHKGIQVSGIDIAANALSLAKRNLESAGLSGRMGRLVEGSVVNTPFDDASFDGILEACVFQHLTRQDRIRTFAEVSRLLKPGGLFVGYMLADGHSLYRQKANQQVEGDPGSLHLADGSSKIHLSNIGLAHFFKKEEFAELLPGFSVVDPCLVTYDLPLEESRKRGESEYRQAMWALYAIK